nr:MAG TPA: tail protein [Caudoviricetes sp.]
MLSFSYLGRKKINTEYYIQDEKDEYVVKEKTVSTGGGTEYVAALNLEDLEAKPWDTFSVKDSTIEEAARLALAGTGWTVGECTVTKKRNAGMMRVSSLGVIEKLCTAFMCERVYDTKNKTVSFYEKAGEDKGVYFTRSLNLRKLTRKDSSYDYYTRIIPVGENGITIEDVNDGKNYLENFQYSNKIRTYIWVDESYTSKQALKDDAEKKLADMSKPLVSYSADVIDLAKQKSEYSLLSFKVGDTIRLFDEDTQIQDTQRIVKMTEYPQDPSKNTCELANMALTFEELRQKEQEAADIINAVVSPDGKIKVSDILHFDDGVAESKSFTDLKNEVDDISLTVGKITTNYLKVEDAKILYASIESLNTTNANIEKLTAEYGKFKSLVAEEFAADRALISDLNTNKANINFANVAIAAIEKGFLKNLMVSQGLLADKVISPEVTVTDVLTGVHVYANDITAGTLSVERLEIRGSENSIVYALNNITGALQAKSVDTLNGEILTERTVTADKIVANSITANEIASDTITGNEIKAKAITAAKIDVADLFAQDITATGSIRGAKLYGTKGEIIAGDIGGWKIANNALYATTEYSPTEYYQTILQNPKTSYFLSGVTVTATGGTVISQKDDTIQVKATGTGNINIRFTGKIPKGNYKLEIESEYRTSEKYDDSFSGSYSYQVDDGSEIASRIENEFVFTDPIGGKMPLDYDITQDDNAIGESTIDLTYTMPTPETGKTYRIRFCASYEDGTSAVIPVQSVDGVPADYAFAIRHCNGNDTEFLYYVTRDGKLKTTSLEAETVSISGSALLMSAFAQTGASVTSFEGLTISSASAQGEAYPGINFVTSDNMSRQLIYNSIEDRFSMVSGSTVKDLAYKTEIDQLNMKIDNKYVYYRFLADIGITDTASVTWNNIVSALPERSGIKMAGWKPSVPGLTSPAAGPAIVITVDKYLSGYVVIQVCDIATNTIYCVTHDGVNYSTWKTL